MNKRANPHSTHPHWKRYLNMTHRARQTAAVLSPHKHMSISIVGIDPSWEPKKNYQGFLNFVNWIESELEKYPELRGGEISLRRKKRGASYGPTNCRIVPAVSRTKKNVADKPLESKRKFESEEISENLTCIESIFGIRRIEVPVKETHTTEVAKQLAGISGK